MIVWENFEIPQLGRKRTVRISLPEGYGQTGGRHPLLILQDGQNVFKTGRSFSGHYWEVEQGQKMWRGLPRLKDLVLVAVDHGELQRLDEYSPWVNRELKNRISWIHDDVGGEGEAYAGFLVETLLPALRRVFLIEEDPAQVGIGGSSMGALISLFAALKYPQVFGKVLCLSPAFWFALPEMEKFISLHPPGKNQRIYLSVGSNETSDETIPDFPSIYLSGARRIAESLAPKMGDRLDFTVLDGAIHSETDWAQIFPGAVEELWKLDLT